LRTSILVESDSTKILVDTSPDLREQAIKHKIRSLDAVVYTHFHSDHVAGIDDLKGIKSNSGKLMAYANQETYDSLLKSYEYAFKQATPIYPPMLEMNIIKNKSEFIVGDIQISTFEQDHNYMTSLGIRFGDLVYSTDACHLDEEAFNAIHGVKIWIVDCLRYSWAPTHSYLEKTLNWIERVKPKLAILTHMSHDMEYNELKKLLPSNVVPAYDGMVQGFNL
jgi:phosphoribosyl 1,2-cyclic phosphate phosphodiesterase